MYPFLALGLSSVLLITATVPRSTYAALGILLAVAAIPLFLERKPGRALGFWIGVCLGIDLFGQFHFGLASLAGVLGAVIAWFAQEHAHATAPSLRILGSDLLILLIYNFLFAGPSYFLRGLVQLWPAFLVAIVVIAGYYSSQHRQTPEHAS